MGEERSKRGAQSRRGERQNHMFYGDLLAHLVKNRLKRAGTLVLNVAERGSSTREKVLTDALKLATDFEQEVTEVAEGTSNIR